MKDKFTKAARASRNFVIRHKTGITVVTTMVVTATAVGALQKAGLKEMTEFIESKGLMDEFCNTLPETVES